MDPKIFELGIPVLTICYGHQLMCQTLGGAVKEGVKGEYGKAQLQVVADNPSPLLQGVSESSTVWMSHRDEAQTPSAHCTPFKALGSDRSDALDATGDRAPSGFHHSGIHRHLHLCCDRGHESSPIWVAVPSRSSPLRRGIIT